MIKGFRQKENVDYFDIYALVVSSTEIKVLLALVSLHDVIVH